MLSSVRAMMTDWACRLPFGTACSGCDGAALVVAALRKEMESRGVPLSCPHEYGAESDATKRSFIMRRFPNMKRLYMSVHDMPRGSAPDACQKGASTDVPGVALLLAGFPCQDASAENSQW